MTVKFWPFEFVCYHSGRFIACEWFRAAGEDMYEEVEQRAEQFADVEQCEVDIIGCSVMPSGRIGSRERIGIRCRPSHDGMMPSVRAQF